MYLRRRQLRVKDLTDPAKVPYLLNPDEQGMNPDQLQAYVMNSLLPFNGKLSTEDWWTVPVLNGTPLYQIGFWNLLYRVLSSEAYQYMYDAGGYYTNVANSTSPLSLPISEYDPNNKYYTLDEGYEELPRVVADRFATLGGEIHRNHRLDSFGRRGPGRRLRAAASCARDGEREDDGHQPGAPRCTSTPTGWCWRCRGAPSSSSAGTSSTPTARRGRPHPARQPGGRHQPGGVQDVPGLPVSLVARAGRGGGAHDHRHADPPDLLLRHGERERAASRRTTTRC